MENKGYHMDGPRAQRSRLDGVFSSFEMPEVTNPLSTTANSNEAGMLGKNRDPKKLNQHLQIEFSDVVGEPKGLHTLQLPWDASVAIYKYTQLIFYNILVIILSPFIAFAAALTFALFAFMHVWILTPFLRLWKLTFAYFRKLFMVALLAFLSPIVEVAGQYWSSIKIRYQKLPHGNEDPSIDEEYFNV